MQRALRCLSILVAVAFAACFGTGPAPSLPTDATVVFTVPSVSSTDNCSGNYVGDVAFGSDAGYALVVPYTPRNNSCGGGGGGAIGTVNVYRFHYDATDPTMIGSAGSAGNATEEPRLGVSNGSAVWAYADASSLGSLTIGPNGPSIMMGPLAPVGLVADGSTIYVGASSGTSGATSVNDPDFPGTNNGSPGGNAGSGAIYAIHGSAASSLPVGPQFSCASVNGCLASNPTSLFYFESATNMTQVSVNIVALKKADNTVTSVGAIPNGGVVTLPVGISATPSTIAWAVSVDHTGTDPSVGGCTITARDLASGATTVVLMTTEFSCLGLALDATENAAYFSIVSAFRDDNNGNGNNSNVYVNGIGLGRIDLATQDFTSIALGFSIATSGPRRVFPLNDDVYAIDPKVIAKIPKAAFANHHDFKP